MTSLFSEGMGFLQLVKIFSINKGSVTDLRKVYSTPQFLLGSFFILCAILIAIAGYSPGYKYYAEGFEAYIRAVLVSIVGGILILYSFTSKDRKSISWTMIIIISLSIFAIEFLSHHLYISWKN